MSTPKFILGTLAALTAGVVIGMLIAPEKGSTLRKKIVKKGEDLAGELGEKIEGKFDEVTGAISSKFLRKKEDALTNRKEVEV